MKILQVLSTEIILRNQNDTKGKNSCSKAAPLVDFGAITVARTKEKSLYICQYCPVAQTSFTVLLIKKVCVQHLTGKKISVYWALPALDSSVDKGCCQLQQL